MSFDLRMLDEFVRVEVLNPVWHPDGAESVLEVLRADAQVLEVPAELVVNVCVPVRKQHDRMEARAYEVRKLRADHKRGADMHQPRGLEADICPRRAAAGQEDAQLVPRYDLLGAAEHSLGAFLLTHGMTEVAERG